MMESPRASLFPTLESVCLLRSLPPTLCVLLSQLQSQSLTLDYRVPSPNQELRTSWQRLNLGMVPTMAISSVHLVSAFTAVSSLQIASKSRLSPLRRRRTLTPPNTFSPRLRTTAPSMCTPTPVAIPLDEEPRSLCT